MQKKKIQGKQKDLCNIWLPKKYNEKIFKGCFQEPNPEQKAPAGHVPIYCCMVFRQREITNTHKSQQWGFRKLDEYFHMKLVKRTKFTFS